MERRAEGDGVAVHRGHLDNLVERAVLADEPAARSAAGRIVLGAPEDIGMIGGYLVNKDELSRLDARIACERDGIGAKRRHLGEVDGLAKLKAHRLDGNRPLVD